MSVALTNHLAEQLGTHSHATLARKLDVDQSTIHNIFYGKLEVNERFILKVYDATFMSIEEIREFLP